MKPENPEPLDSPLLTAKQLADRYKISVQSVWRAVGEKRFPDPIYVAPRSPRWIAAEVDAALAAHRRSPKEAKAARRAPGPPLRTPGSPVPGGMRRTPPDAAAASPDEPECLNCYAEDAAARDGVGDRANTLYAAVVRLVGGDPRWTGVMANPGHDRRAGNAARPYRLVRDGEVYETQMRLARTAGSRCTASPLRPTRGLTSRCRTGSPPPTRAGASPATSWSPGWSATRGSTCSTRRSPSVARTAPWWSSARWRDVEEVARSAGRVEHAEGPQPVEKWRRCRLRPRAVRPSAAFDVRPPYESRPRRAALRSDRLPRPGEGQRHLPMDRGALAQQRRPFGHRRLGPCPGRGPRPKAGAARRPRRGVRSSRGRCSGRQAGYACRGQGHVRTACRRSGSISAQSSAAARSARHVRGR